MGDFGELVGRSPSMRELYALIERVGPTEATVFLAGETGTGKDLVAAAIHEHSDRSGGPYLPVNCGAIAESLIGSELFGHERGAFTGADRQRRGVFERASGGTLFLDEITEMPLGLQVNLLRVLETGYFTRTGGERRLKANVRLIAATNRDLGQAVADGKIRQDLLYRLLVFPIEIPPLRERRDDIERLAEHFVGEFSRSASRTKTLAPGAIARLRMHDWPGNVREFRHVLERAFILADDVIGEEVLDFEDTFVLPAAQENVTLPVGITLDAAERRLIEATLDTTGGNKRAAAATLGVSLKTLYNRTKRYAADDAGGAR